MISVSAWVTEITVANEDGSPRKAVDPELPCCACWPYGARAPRSGDACRRPDQVAGRSTPVSARLYAPADACPDAADAARRGLSHPDARVRQFCCKVLDHLMDAESIPALIEALGDPAASVRIAAVHALACDRCKTDPAGQPPRLCSCPLRYCSLAILPRTSAHMRPSWSDAGHTASQPHARLSFTLQHTTRLRLSGRKHPGSRRVGPFTGAPSRGQRRDSVRARRQRDADRGLDGGIRLSRFGHGSDAIPQWLPDDGSPGPAVHIRSSSPERHGFAGCRRSAIQAWRLPGSGPATVLQNLSIHQSGEIPQNRPLISW